MVNSIIVKIMILLNSVWSEYELLDSGNGRRLEKWGKYILSRPDPQCIWRSKCDNEKWEQADAKFITTKKFEKGEWVIKASLPDKWILNYKKIKFWVKLTPFKHTGVFPEQAAHWEWIEEKINNHKLNLKNKDTRLNILNLFGYTGAASLVCADLGTKVTHLDASKPAISWAKDNQSASALLNKPVRWILDDAIKFVQREVKRGVKYDGIIMDPPVYGHGPEGEKWDFYKDFPKLLSICKQVLSDTPLFILINAYAISASSVMLENLLSDLDLHGKIESGELGLKQNNSNRFLSTGIFVRWSVE